jgi:hypothetical protein
MKRHQWTAAEVSVLIETYPHIPTDWLAAVFRLDLQQVYYKAASLGLKKSEAYLASEFACRLRRGDNVGAGTRFRKGQESWNKGKPHPASGRSAETQFKPGVRQGVAVDLYKPIGSERISKDGYLQRKINDDFPTQRRWRAVHLIEWEAVHGPVPAGHDYAPHDRRILVKTESGEIYAAHWVQHPMTDDEAFCVSESSDGTQHLVLPVEWREIQ